MAVESISMKQGVRVALVGMAIVFAFTLVQPSSAATIHTGTYSEDGNPENGGDTFTITNDLLSDEDILTVVIDLTLSPNAVYDIAGAGSSAFASADPYLTDVVDVTLKTLTITFAATQLSPGDTFTFTIDVDDTINGATLLGSDIAGSEITASFATSGDITTAMIAGAPTANWASPVPEPNTVALLGLGLTGLAWRGRRR
jgi:hypothetical protein